MNAARDLRWEKQSTRLLASEEAGCERGGLIDRYLLLASRTWGDRRWSVSFGVPDKIYHVLDDADIRSKDRRYGQRQRQIALEWLNG